MDDAACMQLALAQARLAALAGEVPVGAVVVKDGRVIGVGRNAPLGTHDPTAHAEIVALRAAAQTLGNYRLDGCALFVTLEPCAMCSGAMLHARISRVVFGAFDPKTGAAGSVLNLFAQRTLNHQTSVQGGVLAEEAASVMQAFFQTKRVEKSLQKKALHPLRDDALRTPDACFANVLDYPWAPHYLSDLPSLTGLRMHYLDEGDPAAPITYLCLHGNPSWSYVYRKMIPGFLASGARVVAPDLIGFGKSDKPKKESSHGFSWHRGILLEFVERLNLHNVVLVVQDWGGILGLTLPMEAPHRYAGLLAMNTLLATGDGALTPGFLAWREMCAKNPEFDIGCLLARGNPQMGAAECAAYMAPFPDKGHRSATRAFPAMVPHTPDSDGAALSVRARAFWQQQWSGRSLMAIGMQDPVLGEGTMLALHATVRGCAAPLRIDTAGHFVQEHGQSFVRVVTEYFQ
jgi:tRNA(adenine34) deaminase